MITNLLLGMGRTGATMFWAKEQDFGGNIQTGECTQDARRQLQDILCSE